MSLRQRARLLRQRRRYGRRVVITSRKPSVRDRITYVAQSAVPYGGQRRRSLVTHVIVGSRLNT